MRGASGFHNARIAMHIHRERYGDCHCFCVARCDCQCIRDGIAVDTRATPGNSLPLLYRGPDSWWPIHRDILASLGLATPTPCKCADCERMRHEKFPTESRYTIVERNGAVTQAANFRHPDRMPSGGSGKRNQDWRDAATPALRDARKRADDDPNRSVTRAEKRQLELDQLKTELGL